jgi:hypothetical protein
MTNWYTWLVPVLAAVLIALIPVTFRLSNRLALAEERIERGRQDIEGERRRNDAQDQLQVTYAIALAKFDSKLDLLLAGQKQQQAHNP